MGNKSDTPLADLLLSPEEAITMAGRRGTQAAVLLALYGWPDHPGPVFTEAGGGRPPRSPGDALSPRPRAARGAPARRPSPPGGPGGSAPPPAGGAPAG